LGAFDARDGVLARLADVDEEYGLRRVDELP
jgi:hypothetical protein